MALARDTLKFSMVTKTPELLKVWWANLSVNQQNKVVDHIGHIPSLMNMVAWLELVEAVTDYWDCERMVFRFGDVELTPTIEEFKDCLESVGMGQKWKKKPDHNILIPHRPSIREMMDKLMLVKADWLQGMNISFKDFYVRFGRPDGFSVFKEEFSTFEVWGDTRALAFAICLLGTMVFPEGPNLEINPRIIMVTHAIFYGIRWYETVTYFSLTPVILADLYRSLGECKSGRRFFQGCNLLLQWWIIKYLIKDEGEQILSPQVGSDDIRFHEMRLHLKDFRQRRSRKEWAQIFADLREEDVKWMFSNFTSRDIVIRGKRLPFLALMGIRGIRPYVRMRVLRQFGRTQETPQVRIMNRYIIDYTRDTVPYAKHIIREWKGCRLYGPETMARDRFQARYDEMYKAWLKAELQGEVTSGLNMHNQAQDTEASLQE